MKLSFILILTTLKIGIAQSKTDTLNYVDPNGLKQGYWIITNEIKKLPAYPEAAKVEEGKFLNSRKNGVWTQYYPNGNKKNEITFINNSPRGFAKMYYEDGKIQEEGMWENNRWVGTYKMYYTNGKVFYDFKYNASGKREGPQAYYYENGQVMMKGDMKDGKETGIWEERYENGEIKTKKDFNGGDLNETTVQQFESQKPAAVATVKREQEVKDAPPAPKIDPKTTKPNDVEVFTGNGYAKLYNLNRQLSKDGDFRNFKLINGKDYIYNRNGILTRIAVYKNGTYIGDAPLEAEQ